MIDRITEIAARSTFDFRPLANPRDPLRHLWADWLPYYRLKAAIAETLRPNAILEIGVRYGYSAAAFLHGAPQAKFTGIDLDSVSFGGELGAIDWARRVLPSDRCTILHGNSQTMQEFPGGSYDLIHVDGQQDGDGTYHDLTVALRQASYILLDGYLWTRRNFSAANEFLHQNRLALDWWAVVPGYAGELLIKVRPELPDRARATTTEYYLRDWEGAAHYPDVLAGRPPAAPTPLVSLALLQQPASLIDLGCGRGELARAAADRGIRTVAIDRSPAAVALAQEVARAEPAPPGTLEVILQDIGGPAELPLADCITAAELIPYLTEDETDQVLAKAARSLGAEGRFMAFTSYNAWHRRRRYPVLRQQAEAVGSYLAPSPDTFHARTLGARAVSPAWLRRQLRRHWQHALVWLGCSKDPVAGLRPGLARSSLLALPGIYAVASQAPIDRKELLAAFSPAVLDPQDDPELSLRITRVATAPANRSSTVFVELINRSARFLTSVGATPLHLSYHLLSEQGDMILFEGARTRLTPPCPPGAIIQYRLDFSPPAPGIYRLEVTLVHEGVRWSEVIADAVVIVPS